MKPVSVVIPALGNVPLLERALLPLFAEFDARGAGDELIVVDDTGSAELEGAKAQLFGSRKDATLLTRPANGGFALAFESGLEAARHGLVFSMNSDVVVRRGFLGPLTRVVSESDVFAAAPRVLLNGDPDQLESFTAARLWAGLLSSRGGPKRTAPSSVTPIPFAVGGTCLFDRARFLELGGFDPLFAPFYYEDNDLCWRAWRRGWRTLYVPDSTVEHHHKGTIGGLLTEARRRAAVERGELLFNWKHLDQADLADHIALLFQRALDAHLTDDREGLTWLALALERFAERPAAEPRAADQLSSREILARIAQS